MPRPVLINNWEATHFDFDSDKLIEIAERAADKGIEMFVMDDGWFGHRNSDNSSLGDWVVNKNKIKGGLKHLVNRINSMGMKFGIWFEPEMVSPDSDLYRMHPDWVMEYHGREGTQVRNQYVLDLTRPETVDYVYESIASVLRSANVEYVKWDMNRSLPMSEAITFLPTDREKSVTDRFLRYMRCRRGCLKNFRVFCLKTVREAVQDLTPECYISARRYGALMTLMQLKDWQSRKELLWYIRFLRLVHMYLRARTMRQEELHLLRQEVKSLFAEPSDMNWM